ncbi:hypothetical protein [Mycolicibacterium fallax]|jgi:uncharacterized protein YukE|uniref:Uncharacterized protein n=1 Tax=Mycolicibacterium fallax TaxID=1793 RepID=A0A1X1RK33_MYCFA|nr:hypothetical protein [Mycolicibacterium fallax]ORV08027.1 hypothetical protein AWC04_02435 [Mycolicibacterium fallax]
MGQISVQMAALDTVIHALHDVSRQTQENHRESLNVVTRNAENLGGLGGDGFQHAIAVVNQTYAQLNTKLSRVGPAVEAAKETLRSGDAAAGKQYV